MIGETTYGEWQTVKILETDLEYQIRTVYQGGFVGLELKADIFKAVKNPEEHSTGVLMFRKL